MKIHVGTAPPAPRCRRPWLQYVVLQQCVELGMTNGVARISEWGGGGELPDATEGLGASRRKYGGGAPRTG